VAVGSFAQRGAIGLSHAYLAQLGSEMVQIGIEGNYRPPRRLFSTVGRSPSDASVQGSKIGGGCSIIMHGPEGLSFETK
jgi:hypothetical protein